MNPTKTIMLRLKPIWQITEDEMKEEVLAYNGKEWMQGFITRLDDVHYECNSSSIDEWLGDIILYAILPKD